MQQGAATNKAERSDRAQRVRELGEIKEEHRNTELLCETV